MSRIPICTSSKGKKLVLRNDDKKNITRTIGNGLSDAEKKALLTNHTKPLLAPVRTTVEAPHLKISSPVLSTSTVPNKVAEAEKKLAVAPKIPPYDYKDKARFKALLEKHKTIKRELSNLKEKHLEVSDKTKKMLETIEESNGEIHMLKKKQLNTSKDLSKKSKKYETLQLDYEILRQENEELASKTRLLEEVTTSLKLQNLRNQHLTLKIRDMTHRYETLSEENATLKVLADHLKKNNLQNLTNCD